MFISLDPGYSDSNIQVTFDLNDAQMILRVECDCIVYTVKKDLDDKYQSIHRNNVWSKSKWKFVCKTKYKSILTKALNANIIIQYHKIIKLHIFTYVNL